MAHELPALVDDNTFVGYDFITKTYYVKNMDTLTVAHSPEEAKVIFDITAPYNQVTVEQIRQLSIELEPITSIHFTWEDTGKYIKSIYFNTYKDHSIIYEEPNLYVQGSNEMWDMSSSIGLETVKDFFWSYFQLHLGLEVSIQMIIDILNYYYDIQKPYVYNNIAPREKKTDPIKYSNTVTLSNPDNSSRGVYSATKNPQGLFSAEEYEVVKWGTTTSILKHPIDSMQTSSDIIVMKELLQDEKAISLTGGGTFGAGSTIEVIGTPSNDGTYTVSSLERYDGQSQSVTKIHVSTTIRAQYSNALGTNAYVRIVNEPIATIHEDSITIKGVPHFQIGDLIQMRGTGNIVNKTVKRVDDNGFDTNGVHTYRVITNETINGSSTAAGNKLYTSAWKVTQIGCSDYIKVTGSVGITKITGNKVYLSGIVKSTDFITSGANQSKIWINYGNDNISGPYNVTGVTPTVTTPSAQAGTAVTTTNTSTTTNGTESPSASQEDATVVSSTSSASSTSTTTYNGGNANIVTDGYITLATTPTAYTYTVGATPATLEIRQSYRVDEDSLTIEACHMTSVDGATFDKIPNINYDDIIEIKNSEKWNGSYTVDNIEKHHNYGTNNYLYKVWLKDIKEPLEHYNGTTAILQPRILSECILMNMTYSKRADRMPTGEFMFDNNKQLTKYLEAYYVTPPTSNNYGDINQELSPYQYIGDNLMFTNKAVEGSTIVTNRAQLEAVESPSLNDIAYIKSGPDISPYYERYKYTSDGWEPYPDPTYMICEGLYSDNYDIQG